MIAEEPKLSRPQTAYQHESLILNEIERKKKIAAYGLCIETRHPAQSAVSPNHGSIAMPGGLGTVLLPFSGMIVPRDRARTREGRFA